MKVEPHRGIIACSYEREPSPDLAIGNLLPIPPCDDIEMYYPEDTHTAKLAHCSVRLEAI